MLVVILLSCQLKYTLFYLWYISQQKQLCVSLALKLTGIYLMIDYCAIDSGTEHYKNHYGGDDRKKLVQGKII